MTAKIRQLRTGSYLVRGVDKREVRVMEQALQKEARRRAKLRLVSAVSSDELTTVSERSHPGLFALYSHGRSHFTVLSARASDVDDAEADVADLGPGGLADKYPHLRPSPAHAK